MLKLQKFRAEINYCKNF